MTHRLWRPNWITVAAACLLGYWAIADSRNTNSLGLRVVGILLFVFAASLSAYLLKRRTDAR